MERVAAFLRAAQAEARIEEFGEGTETADAAAETVGCRPSQIVKSLVFRCDGRSLLVLVPGDRRADVARVAGLAGCTHARVARADEVQEATGFVPGAVAPFPLTGVARVFLERRLLAHDRVWVGAGSGNHLAVLAPAELVRLARAEPVDVVVSEAVSDEGRSRPEG